jgi:hypothetical protein
MPPGALKHCEPSPDPTDGLESDRRNYSRLLTIMRDRFALRRTSLLPLTRAGSEWTKAEDSAMSEYGIGSRERSCDVHLSVSPV